MTTCLSDPSAVEHRRWPILPELRIGAVTKSHNNSNSINTDDIRRLQPTYMRSMKQQRHHQFNQYNHQHHSQQQQQITAIEQQMQKQWHQHKQSLPWHSRVQGYGNGNSIGTNKQADCIRLRRSCCLPGSFRTSFRSRTMTCNHPTPS